MTELAPQPMRRAASLSEQPESTKAKARRRRSSSRSPLPFGLGIGVQAEKQSTYIIGFFLEEIYYILYTWLNNKEMEVLAWGLGNHDAVGLQILSIFKCG
jgi:hypothetical protein